MSEVSTRIWLDEKLWDKARRRALAGGTTIRELIPRLVSQVLTKVPAVVQETAPAPAVVVSEAPPSLIAPAEPGPPVVVLSEVYRCDVCGTQVRLGGLSNHMGKQTTK